MSTKQVVIFTFMLLFLAGALGTLGAWFHFATELDIKKNTLEALELQKREAKGRYDKLTPLLTDLEKGLDVRLRKQTDEAEEKYKLMYTDPTASRYNLYLGKEPEIEGEWKKGSTEWAGVYSDWTGRNKKIQDAIENLKKQRVEAARAVDQAQQELVTELKTEDAERKKVVTGRKDMEEKLSKIRYDSEEYKDKLSKVTREVEKPTEYDSDGVVVFSDPDMNSYTVDVGFEEGAKTGMKFNVYSGRHNIPVQKGRLLVTDVRAHSSDAILLPPGERPLRDPITGWEATDPKMRYSVYSGVSTDPNSPPTEPTRLEKQKTRKDLIEELRIERIRQEEGPEAAAKAAGHGDTSSEPPIALNKRFEPIAPGDWISSTDFVRIVSGREFSRKVTEELLELKEVNLGSLTFFLTDSVRAFRREFLKRLIERNRCKVALAMSADVNYVVTTKASSSYELLKESLRSSEKKEDVNVDIATRRKTLAALEEGRKFSAGVIAEEELEGFFLKRQRKSELAKGKVIQPGQSTFAVVGETRLRSVRETGLYIQEHGGVLIPKLTTDVDYVVVGEGLSEAKLDRTSGRIYYSGENAPANTPSFFDGIKTMGLKVIREGELAHFFGLEK